ncbi:MAG: putative manganese transporter [Anaerovoracaceae bacterium]
MIEALIESLVDSLKLIPFLFLTYLAMGILERTTSNKTKEIIKDAGKVGPLWGGILGAFPQCGFSAAASNFFAGRVITIGTLISIYLSTSDEMLPIFISESVPISTILKILGIKIFIGMVSGFVIEILLGRLYKKKNQGHQVEDIDHGHGQCNCGTGLFVSSIAHTLKIFVFILLISLGINLVICFIGEESLSIIFSNIPVLGEAIAGLVGLIPNCAASVVITQLYLEGIISAGPMMSGLLASAGVGILVLFKENKNLTQNFTILGILYGVSVAWGVLIEALGIVF